MVIASSTPAETKHFANFLQHPIALGSMAGGHRDIDIFGNGIVAVNARDFFDQIDFARKIAPPTWRNDFEHPFCPLPLRASA